MKAKASKCKSISFCNSTSQGSTTYGAVKAHLRIGNALISDIADTPFKFLGRLISKILNERDVRNSVLKSFNEHITLVDAQFLKGATKAWIYNNYILAFMSWPLLIYDFPLFSQTSSLNQ